MFFYVFGYYLLMGKRSTVSFPSPPILKTEGDRVFVLAMLFIVLAYFGQVLLLYEYKGLFGLREQYILHTKTFNQSTIEKMGLMLWSTFHPFGVWLTTLAFAYAKNRHKRTVYGILLFFILTIAVTTSILIFGSRLQLLVLGVGVILIYHWKIKTISRRDLFLAAPALIIFSIWVVAYRTNNIAELTLESIIYNLGHSVLDTFIAINNYPIPRSFVTSYERWIQLPLSLIPRVIWPDKPVLATIRLDWLIADYYRGYTGRSTTGYPSSMFAEWFVLGGWPLVTLLSFVMGLFTGFIDKWFLRNKQNRYIIIVYISIFVSMVNYFKDGDIVMSVSSTIKSLAIALLVYTILQWDILLSSNHVHNINSSDRSPIRQNSL
jgi:oligosaccharide repeat unit polymerase